MRPERISRITSFYSAGGPPRADAIPGMDMTRTEHILWAKARIERLEIKTSTTVGGGGAFPTMTVKIHYSWKSRRFTKTIRTVLN